MNSKLESKVVSLLIGIMSDGFNRSITALEQDNAINTNIMRKEYNGIGSKYYDMVSEQLEYTAKHAAPHVINSLLQELNEYSE